MSPDSSNNANGKSKAPEKPASVLTPGVTPWLRCATQTGPSSAPVPQSTEVSSLPAASGPPQVDKIEDATADPAPSPSSIPIIEVDTNLDPSLEPSPTRSPSPKPALVSSHNGSKRNWQSQGQNMGEVHDFERLKHQDKLARDKQQQEQSKREQKDKDDLSLCRRHFFIGCLGLPLLHFVNVMYFYPEWSGGNRNFHVQRYIYLSIIVGLIESFIWILWFVVFQLSDSLDEMSILHTNSTIVGTLSR